ncbi:hypothetical protein FAES_3523 [Fibrella aestuarina BUZ 2]|uniref:Uncharacterized protein n=1 Tax=Fibrella aestuarina BUZ 2 TaxID=1166018 RepID=I0KBM7_9BACT|nr:hypothetical protein FAES_3523 [Fibrella aestuarina BUZ 2]
MLDKRMQTVTQGGLSLGTQTPGNVPNLAYTGRGYVATRQIV